MKFPLLSTTEQCVLKKLTQRANWKKRSNMKTQCGVKTMLVDKVITVFWFAIFTVCIKADPRPFKDMYSSWNSFITKRINSKCCYGTWSRKALYPALSTKQGTAVYDHYTSTYIVTPTTVIFSYTEIKMTSIKNG